MSERAHRVVSNLRADEVLQLERHSKHHVPRAKCPHLPLFWNRGKTPVGNDWWACNICAVGDESWDYPSDRLELAEAIERAERRNAMIGMFSAGAAIGIVATLFLGGVLP